MHPWNHVVEEQIRELRLPSTPLPHEMNSKPRHVLQYQLAMDDADSHTSTIPDGPDGMADSGQYYYIVQY